jgi:chromosome segregation and condensation protein ScpB
MNDASRKILAFLFLRGLAVRKDLVMKACRLSESDLESALQGVREILHKTPFLLLETREELELVLNEKETLFFADYIKKEGEADLSPGTLQTLTIISYLDRPSLYEISFVRGVSAKQSISSLLSKGFISECGNDSYDISPETLLYLGVTRKEDLPNYAEIRAGFLEKIQHATSS